MASTLPQWSFLDDGARSRLDALAAWLLEHPSWEPARGFRLDDHIRATIAGRAALLGVGLEDPVFPNVRAIVVHPATMLLRGSAGPMPGSVLDHPAPVLGHTSAHGPVFVAWDVVRRQARRPDRAADVVLHEFAHKLDARDGVVDGTPPIRDARRRERFVAVFRDELGELRAGAGSPLLPDYAGTGPGELFAVATEVFFDRGADLRADRPELYDVLRSFYAQDPATWRHALPEPSAR